MRAGECEQEGASANKGGGATVAAAATVGLPSPPFIYLFSLLLSEMAAVP